MIEILFTIIIGLALSLIAESINHLFDKRKMYRLEMDLEIAQFACKGYEEKIANHARMVDEFTNKELESEK